jgi:hypothetical protein
MLLAAAGAALIGDWLEGAVLLFLFSLSGTLEAFATYRTARSIESLIALRPATAALLQDGSERQVAESVRANVSPSTDRSSMAQPGPMNPHSQGKANRSPNIRATPFSPEL